MTKPIDRQRLIALIHKFAPGHEDGTVLVYERWRDQDALAAHLWQPSVTGVLGAWADKIDTSGVRKFDAGNERGFMD